MVLANVLALVMAGAAVEPQGAGAAPAVAPTENDPRVGAAKTACGAGEVSLGVRLLAELYTDTNDPIWIFNQGRCYQQNGQVEPGIQRFREYLRKTGGTSDASVQATRDEVTHYIRELEQEQRTARPPGPYDRAGEGWRTAGIAVTAAGGAAIVGGVVFSLLTHASANRRSEILMGEGLVPEQETRELTRLDREGQRYEVLQWVGYGVGAAALATGAALYWKGHTAATEVGLTPTFFPGGAGALLSMGL